MENKKYLPLKVIHLAFMVLGLCFYVYSLLEIKGAFSGANFIIFAVINTITAACALISGILYLTHGYKKNAAVYYKGYVLILLINEIFTAVLGNVNESYLFKFVCIINLVLMTILTVGKDLGKTNSFTLVGLILIGKTILLINLISVSQAVGSMDVNMLLGMVGQIILTITTALMVCGKYLDKESRGAK